MKKYITSLLMIVAMIFTIPNILTVFAHSATDPVMSLDGAGGDVSANLVEANNYGTAHGATGAVLEVEGDMIYFVRDNYQAMDYEGKKEFMSKALSGIQNSGLASTTKSKVYNFIKERDPSTSQVVTALSQDYSGNLTDANETLKKWGVAQTLSKLLGVLCIMVFSFMALSMVTDVLYLNIPFVTQVLDEHGENGKPKWVSNDAIDAWRETAGYGGNTNLAFLKKKVVSLIFVSLILVALVSGKLYTIIGSVVDFAEYVLGIFGV